MSVQHRSIQISSATEHEVGLKMTYCEIDYFSYINLFQNIILNLSANQHIARAEISVDQ